MAEVREGVGAHAVGGVRDYRVFGSVLRSELEFPELESSTAGTPTWSLRVGNDAPERADLALRGERQIGSERYRLLAFDGGARLEYSHAGVFDLSFNDGVIAWYPNGRDDAKCELARSIVLGPVLALALEASGHLCLHGSAVALQDGAVAFVAPKHHGKSTLAMALARAGAHFISDDSLALRPGVPTLLQPGVTSARLWDDTARELHVDELCDRVVTGIKTTATGFADDRVVRVATPLSAVYLIEPEYADDSAAPVRRTALSRPQAAATLAQQAKLPDSLVGYAAAGARLGTAVRLAARVPVYRLHVARSFGLLPEVVQQIVDWHGGVVAPRQS
jgi:hypothetical protein